jgi:UPF0755 protein
VSAGLARLLLRYGLLLAGITLVSMLAVEIFSQAAYHQEAHVYVIVDRGMPFSEIGRRLESKGLIGNRTVFLVLGRLFDIEHRAKAGRYRFERTASMWDVLRTLYRGATYREHVLVRAGKRLEGIAEVLSREAAVDSLAFMELARDSIFVSNLGIPSSNAEGYLFPATYDVEWREGADSMIRRMVSNFFRVYDDSMRARTERMGMTMNEIVTLASIIEKEAMVDEERPRISAVFHNRLEIGMRLQADPTVRYAIGKWRGRVLYRDLESDSPFNTYRHYGLPPHPICNPGRASLLAALYPTPGADYIYFVAQGDGTHYFSRTAGEHNRAKARYKRFLRERQEARDAARQVE